MDHETVCCMCGDVGFSDKLFRCNKCLNRFQHSYCSNFYKENMNTQTELCDWCQSEGRRRRLTESVRTVGCSKRPNQSESSSAVGKSKREEDVRENYKVATADKGKNGESPSPRTRRYKLLKDVM